MSKKDQGKRGVVVQMDVPRTFRWTIAATEEFEDLVGPELVKHRVIKHDEPFTVRGVLSGVGLEKPSILRLAV
jgi:hypothetical protein